MPADRSSAAAQFPTTIPAEELTAALRARIEGLLDAGAGELPAGLERDLRRELLLLHLRGGKGQVTLTLDLAPKQPAEWKFASGAHGREKRDS